SLVDDGGGLQPVVTPFARQLSRGNRPELFVDDGDQAVERLTVPVFPLVKNACDIVWRPRSPIHRSGELSTFWPRQSKRSVSGVVPTSVQSLPSGAASRHRAVHRLCARPHAARSALQGYAGTTHQRIGHSHHWSAGWKGRHVH